MLREKADRISIRRRNREIAQADVIKKWADGNTLVRNSFSVRDQPFRASVDPEVQSYTGRRSRALGFVRAAQPDSADSRHRTGARDTAVL